MKFKRETRYRALRTVTEESMNHFQEVTEDLEAEGFQLHGTLQQQDNCLVATFVRDTEIMKETFKGQDKVVLDPIAKPIPEPSWVKARAAQSGPDDI
jgi:hypothetical protein